MEAPLDSDIERVSSVMSQESLTESETTIRVALTTTEGQTVRLTVHRDEAIYDAVGRCLECDAGTIRYVQLGDNAVGVDGESFREEEIEDGAKLGVSVGLSFENVVDATVALNPGNAEATKERLMTNPYGAGPVTVDPDDPLHVTSGDLQWG